MSPRKLLSIFISLGLLSGCGPGFQSDPQLYKQGQNLKTGALNVQEKPYTTFSATSSFEKLKSEVSDTPEAKAFAASIDRAQLNPVDPSDFAGNSRLEVLLIWKDSKEPELFVGDLIYSNRVYGAILKSKALNRFDITLHATCSSESCNEVQSKVISNKSSAIIGGILFQNEDRILKSGNSTSTPEQMSKEAREFFLHHKEGTAVKVRASVVVNGPSQYEITESKKVGSKMVDETLLKGELVSPEGDKIELSEIGSEIKNIGQTDLVGNDEDNGELVFLTEDSGADEPAPTVSATPTTTSPQSTVQRRTRGQFTYTLQRKPTPKAQNQPLHQRPAPQNPAVNVELGRNLDLCTIARPASTSPEVKETIQNLLKDCASGDTKKYGGETKAQFFAKYHGKRTLERVLQLNKTVEAQPQQPERSDEWGFHYMGQQMKMNNLPVVLAAAITAIESNFVPTARGSSGECGVMQFMSATGRGLGLKVLDSSSRCSPNDERVIYRTAMPAFAKMLKQLDGYFPNNALLILSAYNMHPRGVNQSQRSVEARLRNNRQTRTLNPEEIRLLSSDFFWHKENRSLPNIEYVGYAAAAAQQLLNTQVYDQKIRVYPSMKAE